MPTPVPLDPQADHLRPSIGLTEAEVLDRVGECATTWMRAGAEMLSLAYEWAVAHPAERLDPAESGKPGRERAKLYGGPGTPEVTEFAAAELGARMGRGTHAGRRHIAAALDLKLRLPLLWSRVQSLEVRDTYAIHVAEATRTLTTAEAAWVDTEVAESADGRIPWTRFQTLVAGKVTAAAPHLAREREERAAAARCAKVLRSQPGDAGTGSGMGTFLVRAPLPVITALDTAVTTLAGRLADTLPTTVTESEDQPTTDDLRVQAVALLATGHASDTETDLTGVDLRDLLPATSLVVHLFGGTTHADLHTCETTTVLAGRDVDEHGEEIDRIARLESTSGQVAVTETWLREVLGRHSRFEVRPVLDIDGLAAVDAYEIPARHRRAVQLRHPVETFPWGTTSATRSHTQVDHVRPWRPPDPEAPHDPGSGRTSVDNLTPLATHHHRLKTHGGWQLAQPFPGIHLWRDPHGATYLVDPTGTRSIDDAPTGAAPTRERRSPIVELYRAERPLVLAPDFAAA